MSTSRRRELRLRLLETKRQTDRDLNRGIRTVAALELEGMKRFEGRLRQKARLLSAVGLSRMHEKWMAEVYGAGLAGRRKFRSVGGLSETAGQFHKRHAAFSRGSQNASYIAMRPHTDPGWRIAFSNVGEEKQQQQGAAFGLHVDTPVQKRGIRVILRRIAGIDMPAGIPRVALARKAYRECAECREWPPTVPSGELVKGGNEPRRGCRSAKRWIEVAAEADHRAGPGRAVERIASGVTPQDLASFFCGAACERCVQP